ncbi:hypothetical protein CA13_21990 [Planctomycetes bacterium CA13]|uniref:D-ribose pyranase n=1 Tax=Novipirellula herctigrandis TaxID=2527986 RepID=A0A5C5Z2B9_9BACT|nr:hypothetical protein CA13_21990 [Planctomycetes bacterium CA13]
MTYPKMTTAIVAALFLVSGQALAEDWKPLLSKRLPQYGHRNWIIIADSAYPKQSAPGIETIYTGDGQLDVLKHVLKEVDAAKHVRPVIMLDAELESVPEENAPGVETYREGLKSLFGERPLKVMKHEDIIRELDEGSKLFNILLLKTDMTIPYTSVFIELDCGYWSEEKETELRDLIERGGQEAIENR